MKNRTVNKVRNTGTRRGINDTKSDFSLTRVQTWSNVIDSLYISDRALERGRVVQLTDNNFLNTQIFLAAQRTPEI
jgi:hypothetical protein